MIPAYSLAADNPVADNPQQATVTGTVTDAATGDAMPGVNIQVKGTSQGAITDIAGKYAISNVDRNATLVFSFIGYVSQEIAIGNRTVIDVTLAGVVTDLDEVVVVGYSTQKRANVVGSVTSLSGEGLANQFLLPTLTMQFQDVCLVPLSYRAAVNLVSRLREFMVRGRSTLGAE